MNDPPWLWLIAGPNGAGKSTYATNLAADVAEIVRPDQLALLLSPTAPERVALQAGRLAIGQIRELLKERRSFAVETTLSGRLHPQIIRRARSEGWSVGGVYIGLASADLAIQRVRERTQMGGHHVPPGDVRRRFARSLRNLADVADHLDYLLILDNSSDRKPMKRTMELRAGHVVFSVRRMPKWIRPVLPSLISNP